MDSNEDNKLRFIEAIKQTTWIRSLSDQQMRGEGFTEAEIQRVYLKNSLTIPYSFQSLVSE